MFALTDACMQKVDSMVSSSSEVDVLFLSACRMQNLIKEVQEAIHFPLIEYNITEKPQDQFDDRVDAMDLNFAPKLRVKHNARKEWMNEGTFFCFSSLRNLKNTGDFLPR